MRVVPSTSQPAVRPIDELRGTLRAVALLVRTSPMLVACKILLLLFLGLVTPFVLTTTGRIIDALTGGRITSVGGAVLLLGGLLVGGELASVLDTVAHGALTGRFVARVKVMVLEAASRLPGLAWFEDAELQDLVRAGSAAGNSAMRIAGGFVDARWASVVTTIGVMPLVSRLGWWAPMLLLGAGVPDLASLWKQGRREHGAFRDSLAGSRQAAYHRELAIGLEAAKETRLFGLGQWLVDRNRRLWLDSMRAVWSAARQRMWRTLAAELVRPILVVPPLVAALLAATSGRLSPGQFTAVVSAAAVLVSSSRAVWSLPQWLRRDTLYLPALWRFIDLSKTEPRLDMHGTQVPPRTPASAVRFESVHFTYPGRDRPVLDGLDLDLRAGESLALVGANGAGKSTIVKLLCRLYDPDAGRITLDGIDAREFDLDEWRRRIAVVFQDFVQFPLPARDNVGFGCVERRHDDELLDRAAARAGAAALVDELSEGWDSMLSRAFGGTDLSQGQWQRIALARAMVALDGRDAPILVLDEPTAALDVQLEHDLFERFAEMTSGRTTLLVSHRFSTVRMTNRVALIEHGRLAEQGTHDELLASAGHYAALYDLQARRFREEGTVE